MKSVLSCVMCILLVSATAAAQYVAVDITPANMSGTLDAISGPLQGGVVYSATNVGGHGFLFNGTKSLDVNPANWYSSQVLGAGGNQEVGYGLRAFAQDLSGSHALLWNGFSAKKIDLNIAKWRLTIATCTNGIEQGGYGIPPKAKGKPSINTHALIWSGSAASGVDLNPTGMVESRIYGCADTSQVGYVMPTAISGSHAAMWFGSAASAVDLNPDGYITSIAVGAVGNQQVGSGVSSTSNRHALVWSGSAASVVDLHPDGYSVSVIYATNGIQQVGQATDNGAPPRQHAIVWSGTATSAVDLNQFLPPSLTDASARAIDANGTIVGLASTPGQGQRMIVWVKTQ
jgi:hypothetical protein